MATKAAKKSAPAAKKVVKTKKAVTKAVKKVVKKAAPQKANARKSPAAKKPAVKKIAAKKVAPKSKTESKLFTPMGLTSSARERGVSVDDYARELVGWKQQVVERIRQIVREVAPNAKESIKWGQPVYELNGPFAWMKAFTKHIGYGFWRGAELPDPSRVLEGDGERMRHVKVRAPDSIPFAALRQLIQDAVAANLAKGDPTKR